MADESMVRNLAEQAEAIWPQEEPVFRRHGLPDDARILDVGCGTGEITGRLGRLLPRGQLIGVDLIEAHLALARSRFPAIEFRVADAFELPFAGGTFDLVVCRHVLQSIPTPERVIAEMMRVAKPGGVLHLIAEDYDMIHAGPTRRDVSAFWHAGPRAYAKATSVDLHIGRHAFHHLRRLGARDIAIDYAMVDTLRVPRATFAAMFEAWRDGYAPTMSQHLGISEAEARDYFDATIECVRDPDGYALWVVPIVTARTPV
jgi:ubiquinone/menaquinone biosynthesis C-methylase UbiE